MSDFDNKTLANIEQFGCSVLHILAEDDLPPYSYSVGISQTSHAPEVIVIGLKQPMAQSVVNRYNQEVRSKKSFVSGKRYEGFLQGFDIQMQTVDIRFYEEYFGYGLAFYGGPNFEVMQIIYPNTLGVWPFDEQADDWFRSRQPILK